MDPLHVFGGILAIVGTTVGATWVLRSKLGDIELAIRGQGLRVDNIEARVIKLEAHRERRR